MMGADRDIRVYQLQAIYRNPRLLGRLIACLFVVGVEKSAADLRARAWGIVDEEMPAAIDKDCA